MQRHIDQQLLHIQFERIWMCSMGLLSLPKLCIGLKRMSLLGCFVDWALIIVWAKQARTPKWTHRTLNIHNKLRPMKVMIGQQVAETMIKAWS